jgi:NADH-quinone oxidoreductase subunit N
VNTIPVSFSAIGPEIILLGTAAVLLVFAIFLPDQPARQVSAGATVVALAAATAFAASQFHDHARAPFDHTLRIDAFGQSGRMLVFIAAIIAVAFSWGMGHLRERGVEYHALLLTAAAGMSLLCVANSFVTAFVALELFSLALYVLVAIETDDLLSLEGGLKYLIIGSVGAAFLLYGAALTYGASGQLEFDRIQAGLAAGDHHDVLVLMGLTMVVVGLGFKANAAPFHMWTPDAYEAAPPAVTGFMSTGVKAAAFAAFARVFLSTFEPFKEQWAPVVAAIAIATMVLGTVVGVAQSSLKRMLAYSSIAHGGYLLVGLVAANQVGKAAILFYLLVYSVTNLAAFGVIAMLGAKDRPNDSLRDYAGLWQSHPALAALMTVSLLSLGGLPPTAGFIGKWYIFSAAVSAGYYKLAIIGVLTSVVSVFFYLRVVVMMYMADRDTAQAPSPISAVGMAALSLAIIAIVYLGILPAPVLDLATRSIATIF